MNNLVAVPDDQTLFKSMMIFCPECYETVIKAHAMRYLNVGDTYKFMEIKQTQNWTDKLHFSKTSREKARTIEDKKRWKKLENLKLVISHLSNQEVITINGLFRVNGNWNRLKEICKYMETANGDLSGLSPDKYGPHDFASAFKNMLKNHKPKIFQTEFERRLLTIIPNINVSDKVTAISLLIRLLPEYLQAVIFTLFAFLKKTSENNVNMKPFVLSRLFAPSLTDSDLDDLVRLIPVIELMIEYGDTLNTLPEDIMTELKIMFVRYNQSSEGDVEFVYNGFSSQIPPDARLPEHNEILLREMENLNLNPDGSRKLYFQNRLVLSDLELGSSFFDSDKENTLR